MATMKTLRLVSGTGIKYFQTFIKADTVLRRTPAVNLTQVRHFKTRRSPLVSNDPDVYTKFEISRDLEEWKYVQDLLPKLAIAKPKPKPEYPSGWKPQDPPTNKPYFITRTANHMLPVYLVRLGVRGHKARTVVRRVQGDVFALEKELIAVVQRVYPHALLQTLVNEVAGQIVFRGDYASAVREYLLAQGW